MTIAAPTRIRCVVRFVWDDKDVVTKADYELTPGCTSYHGARGSLDGARFARTSRRQIRYLDRLKASREFREATEKYRLNSIVLHRSFHKTLLAADAYGYGADP